MKISEILSQDKYTLSFEVFPPKADDAFESVSVAVDEIASLGPSFMSVTYGAGGGTGKNTLKIAENIKDKFNVSTMAHLTCVASTKESVDEKITDFKNAGINNVMALRGDLPSDVSLTESGSWSFNHAVDLIRYLKQSDCDFCIGGACYPETHPESANQAEDIDYLKQKVDAGCDFLTTQMFFDNDLLYNFFYKIRSAGIRVPVIAGIMPITNAVYLKRAISLSGSFMPRRFTNLVDKFGSNPKAMMQAGIAYATEQIIDLYANGVQNVHVYSMNKPFVAKQIQKNLSDIIG